MFRVLVAVSVFAAPAFADASNMTVHTQHGVGSFSEPINYRPNNAEGRVIVRPEGYSEANTKMVRSETVGVTTGSDASSAQIVTQAGRYIMGRLIFVEDGNSQ